VKLAASRNCEQDDKNGVGHDGQGWAAPTSVAT
jgi:hypothetical protein